MTSPIDSGGTGDKRLAVPTEQAANFAARMREEINRYMGLQGNKLDRGVTLRDLVDVGLIDVDDAYLRGVRRNPIKSVNAVVTGGGGGTIVINPGGDLYTPDLTPPPTPTGFDADAAISNVLLLCDDPTYTEGHGHSVSVLYGVPYPGTGALPVFSDAVELTQFSGMFGAYPTNPATEWHLWLKWKTKDGVLSASPAGGTNGLVVTTGADVQTMLNALTGAALDDSAPYAKFAVRADLFYVVKESTTTDAPVFSVSTIPVTNNGVTVPPGVYMADAMIRNGTITNAKIGNLAVDDAKVANLSVAKLIAGSIAVGEYIQSTGYTALSAGWRINGNGDAELNNAIVRGSAYIGAGSVGGILITSDRVQSANYNGTGLGFRLHSNGTLDLPGGSITAGAMSVGFSKNMLGNSDWQDYANNAVPTGWTFDGSLTFFSYTLNLNGFPGYIPAGLITFSCRQNGRYGDANIDSAYYRLYSSVVPVIPGNRYEATCYTGAHRCNVNLQIQWINAANAQISLTTSDTNAGTIVGGNGLADFKRVGCFGVAPVGATQARILIRKGDTFVGQVDSYMFIVAPMFAEAGANQVSYSPYVSNGVGVGTRITPQGINTPSLQALTATLGDVAAGSVRGGSFTGPAWPAAGGGFYLGPSGLMLGNVNAGSYFQVDNAGNIYTPKMNILGGVMTISQVNVINTLNIAGNAVTVPAFGQRDDAQLLYAGWSFGDPTEFRIYNYDSQGLATLCFISADSNDPYVVCDIYITTPGTLGGITHLAAVRVPGFAQFIFAPPAAPRDYIFLFRSSDGSGGIYTINRRAATLLGCKR